ncbi:hypothetical protein JTE90_024553 [Oedothorax gibbosus]|uniref:Uncharacterized protein n=1 Tax=Oedothorax gibbosus TaxID=931172 RepID=A0AAV6VET4_9ARAC|nr:hypothetical protein JTE90_024553 [Oedothorax gibbosus]
MSARLMQATSDDNVSRKVSKIASIIHGMVAAGRRKIKNYREITYKFHHKQIFFKRKKYPKHTNIQWSTR